MAARYFEYDCYKVSLFPFHSCFTEGSDVFFSLFKFFFYFVDLRGCQEVDNEQVFKGASCFLLEGARSSKREKTLEAHYISGKRSGLKVGGRSVCPIAFCDFIFCTYVGHLKQLE